jgi:D-alanyl-D-alanine carboxypeptidase
MTALVAEDLYQTADLLPVPPKAMVGGSGMGLVAGEKLTYRGLLYGMLLDSGNDAAYSLAEDSPGGFGAFVAKMNQKVQNLGLADTHFENPAGFDHPNHYSSAFDLSQIAKQAALDPQIARVVATKDTSVTLWLTPQQATGEATPSARLPKTLALHNLNQLLDQPGVIGMKTGTTENAGENLVGLVDRSNHKIITVMLGSKNRFVETKQLIDWVYNNYSWSN